MTICNYCKKGEVFFRAIDENEEDIYICRLCGHISKPVNSVSETTSVLSSKIDEVQEDLEDIQKEIELKEKNLFGKPK